MNKIFVSLGQTFKNARTQGSYSKETVSDATHISVETLGKIERGALSDFPDLYLKDFINRYAQFLGIKNNHTVEEFLGALEKKSTKIPKLKNQGRTKSPVNYILKALIPLLIVVILIQIFIIRTQTDREAISITNLGKSEVLIETDENRLLLKPNETAKFENLFSAKVTNEEKSLIVVKYYEDIWEVFFKEFEVLIKDGQDS